MAGRWPHAHLHPVPLSFTARREQEGGFSRYALSQTSPGFLCQPPQTKRSLALKGVTSANNTFPRQRNDRTYKADIAVILLSKAKCSSSSLLHESGSFGHRQASKERNGHIYGKEHSAKGGDRSPRLIPEHRIKPHDRCNERTKQRPEMLHGIPGSPSTPALDSQLPKSNPSPPCQGGEESSDHHQQNPAHTEVVGGKKKK